MMALALRSGLDDRLLSAHEQGDTVALVALYKEAADAAETEDARGFYLTHAHVYALELGHPMAGRLRSELVEMGREVPL